MEEVAHGFEIVLYVLTEYSHGEPSKLYAKTLHCYSFDLFVYVR